MELKVDGMSCGGCVSSVRRILSKSLDLEEQRIEVDLDAGKATIPNDIDGAALDTALEKLADAGFTASRRTSVPDNP